MNSLLCNANAETDHDCSENLMLNPNSFVFLGFTCEDIKSAITSLPSKSSFGSDKLPTTIFKENRFIHPTAAVSV